MATKYDTQKRRWSLLPIRALEAVIDILEHGATKYGDDNWKTPPLFTRARLTDALRRHQAAIDTGELRDPESGQLHSAHVACVALFQLHYDVHHLFDLPAP